MAKNDMPVEGNMRMEPLRRRPKKYIDEDIVRNSMATVVGSMNMVLGVTGGKYVPG